MIRTYDQWINSPRHFHYPQLSTEFNNNRIKALEIFSGLESAVDRWRLLRASGENLGNEAPLTSGLSMFPVYQSTDK